MIRFLPKLTAILKKYTQDPAVLASLTIKLLRPVTFTQILPLASPESLIQALESPAPAANILAMTVLHKAAASPAEVSLVAVMTPLLSAFLRRWLASPHVEVGQKGSKVLGDLLDIDCELPPPPPPPTTAANAPGTEIVLRKAPGQGKLWRALLTDRTIYMLLLDLCSGRHPDTSGDALQLSLAQGRVLRILPRLAALNFQAVARSNIPAATPVRLTNGHSGGRSDSAGPRPGEGLLQFAALRMVDRGDTLMHLSLVDFFEALVSLMRVTEYSAAKMTALKALLAEATLGDAVLKEALLTLPERTVDEEAEDLRRWVQEILPGETVRMPLR